MIMDKTFLAKVFCSGLDLYTVFFSLFSFCFLSMPKHASAAIAIQLSADDGHALGGFAWRHAPVATTSRPVVIINAATSVRCQYYARFAEHLFNAGADVLTYDYRGIGLSRTGPIEQLEAGWIEWGQRDFEAVLQYVISEFSNQPIHVVGHSVGGVLVGLAPSNHRISRVFTMGAQHAYWPDYLAHKRLGMWLKWHCFMPAVTRLMGYFPGKRLGWLEDTPAGVVRDWVVMRAHFPDTYRHTGGSCRLTGAECEALESRFASLTAPILALSVTDDAYGTTPAINRLLKLYAGASRWHLRVTPKALNVLAIGHFAFFHSRFEKQLWPIARQWLLDEQLPGDARGHLAMMGELKPYTQ